MPISLSHKANFTVAECSGEMTIFCVSDMLVQLKAALAMAPVHLLVDLSQVDDFDSAALQLLLWLKSRLADDCEFKVIVGENDIVQRVLSLYQLSSNLSANSPLAGA